MAPNAISQAPPTTNYLPENEDTGLKFRPEDIEDSYFGGRIKFRTKIIWYRVFLAILAYGLAFAALPTLFNEIAHFRLKTTLFNFVLHYATGISLGMGWHRLWSHNAYKAKLPLKIVLMLFQTFSGQFTLYLSSLMHMAHHKFTDTDGDPNNATRGFLFAHVGWMLMEPHPLAIQKLKITPRDRLRNDSVVMFQRKYYYVLFVVFGIVLPVMTPVWLWGESLYVSLMLSFLNRIVVANAVACVNSLAHRYGYKPYDKNTTASQSLVTSVVTYGEGAHNFHHAFPSDYRTAEFPFLSIVGSAIEFSAWLGWVYDLKIVSDERIRRKAARSGDGTYTRIYERTL